MSISGGGGSIDLESNKRPDNDQYNGSSGRRRRGKYDKRPNVSVEQTANTDLSNDDDGHVQFFNDEQSIMEETNENEANNHHISEHDTKLDNGIWAESDEEDSTSSVDTLLSEARVLMNDGIQDEDEKEDLQIQNKDGFNLKELLSQIIASNLNENQDEYEHESEN